MIINANSQQIYGNYKNKSNLYQNNNIYGIFLLNH